MDQTSNKKILTEPSEIYGKRTRENLVHAVALVGRIYKGTTTQRGDVYLLIVNHSAATKPVAWCIIRIMVLEQSDHRLVLAR